MKIVNYLTIHTTELVASYHELSHNNLLLKVYLLEYKFAHFNQFGSHSLFEWHTSSWNKLLFATC